MREPEPDERLARIVEIGAQSAPRGLAGPPAVATAARIGRLAPIISEAALATAVDPSLLMAVIDVESRGNPRALSPKGATGLMQLMPAKGGAGNDTIVGSGRNDVIDGGAGDDWLDGRKGSDTYLFGRRSGNDTISESADYDSNTDVVLFDADVRPGDVTIRRDGTGNDLLLTLSGSGNMLRIRDYFYQDGKSPYMIEELRFADGTVWTFDTVLARTLKGGAGNDTIVGSGRNDVIDGGAGDDWLEGRGGSDTYLFGRGSGKDTIYNYDPVTASDDQVHFGANIAADQIWLEKKGSDLQLTLLGTGDSVTIRSWYSGSSYHVDRFRLQNGKELADNNVDKLVDAMAAFAPPASGQTSLPADYRSALAPVLAANWK